MYGGFPMTGDENEDREPAPEALDDEIGRKIRELYQGTVDEGVPDRFTKLLEELKRKESGT